MLYFPNNKDFSEIVLMKLIIASNNAHKIREIKEILGSKFDETLSMREAGIEIEAEENADTLLGNARLKAEAILAFAGDSAVLADDTGLLVDALNGAPGVYSARYAGDAHDDAANREKLLGELDGVPFEKRGAHFDCAMVLLRKGFGEIAAVGKVDGKIIEHELGENGFGYDSLFLYEPEGITFAQMNSEQKNAISHRKNALLLLLAALEAGE